MFKKENKLNRLLKQVDLKLKEELFHFDRVTFMISL